jgi:hypothetical protein
MRKIRIQRQFLACVPQIDTQQLLSVILPTLRKFNISLHAFIHINSVLRMKQLALLLLMSMLFVACGGDDSPKSDASDADNADGTTAEATSTDDSDVSESDRRYEIRSGMIEMKMSMLDAMLTVYWDDYGQRQAQYVSVEIMGMKSEQVDIYEDGYTTSYNLMDSTGQRRKSPPPSFGPSGSGDMPDFSKVTPEMKEMYGLEEIGTRDILGKTATGYKVGKAAAQGELQVWVWEGVPLYMEMGMGPDQVMTLEATNIETDIDVPEDKFQVPDFVKIEEM